MFIVQGNEFKTQKDFVETFEGKYKKYRCFGKKFPVEITGDDKEYIVEALTKYHNAFIGCNNIGKIVKEMNDNNGFHLRVYYEDGSEYGAVSKSFIANYGKDTTLKDIKTACRKVTDDLLTGLKNDLYKGTPVVKCVISNEMIERDNCHIDHASPYTFDYIFNEFITFITNDLNLHIGILETVKDVSIRGGMVFKHEKHVKWFEEFHSEYNQYLRPVSKLLNLKMGNRGVIK